MTLVGEPTRRRAAVGLGALALVVLSFPTGCVEQRCNAVADCPAPKICGAEGLCVFECVNAGDCAEKFVCVEHVCTPASSGPIDCPEDMVPVSDTFCIDRFEASRPDATATSAGQDASRALSVIGVIPWQVASNEVAESACNASGKRLCLAGEWQLACAGREGKVYAYGNSYETSTCNGIDAFGRDAFHLAPTGSFPGCTNEWGAFDLNGNVWEHVAQGSDEKVRGGAFNCGDSAALHRCDYVPGFWAPSARGFRCCLTPGPMGQGARDGGLTDGGDT